MSDTSINSLFETLRQPALGNRLFAHVSDDKITYGQLQEEIDKLHGIFQKNGIKKGDKVILSTNEDYYTALFFLAFLRYGMVTVFIDPDVPPKRAIAIIINITDLEHHFYKQINLKLFLKFLVLFGNVFFILLTLFFLSSLEIILCEICCKFDPFFFINSSTFVLIILPKVKILVRLLLN